MSETGSKVASHDGYARIRVGDAQERCLVLLRGRVSALTYSPLRSRPTLSAILSDDTGSIELIWLGRRSISEIHTNTRLEVWGTVTRRTDSLSIINPSYNVINEDGNEH